MFLDSITPKELQIYVVIGTFLISLLIDIIFSIKRKEWRFFTLSVLGIWAFMAVAWWGFIYLFIWRLPNDWYPESILGVIVQICLASIFYFGVQLKFKLDIEKKDPDCSYGLLDYLNSKRKKEEKRDNKINRFSNYHSYSDIPKNKYVKVCPNCGSTNVSFQGSKVVYDFCKDCGYGSNINPFSESLRVFPEIKGTGDKNFDKLSKLERRARKRLNK